MSGLKAILNILDGSHAVDQMHIHPPDSQKSQKLIFHTHDPSYVVRDLRTNIVKIENIRILFQYLLV